MYHVTKAPSFDVTTQGLCHCLKVKGLHYFAVLRVTTHRDLEVCISGSKASCLLEPKTNLRPRPGASLTSSLGLIDRVPHLSNIVNACPLTCQRGAYYPPHSHSGLTTHLIRRGSLTITYPKDPNPTKETFGVGARVDVPAGKVHEVWIGDQGTLLYTHILTSRAHVLVRLRIRHWRVILTRYWLSYHEQKMGVFLPYRTAASAHSLSRRAVWELFPQPLMPTVINC